MIRRRRRSQAGDTLSLDSLLDALTNVVAVLILVLVLVQMDVTQKVAEFFENLEPATPEQISAAEATFEETSELLKKKEALLTEDPPTKEEIEEEKRQLALLEKNIELRTELLADRKELKILHGKLKLEQEIEQEEVSQLQQEIARLEGLLDDTPVLESKPTEVTIPNSRPIPRSAEVYYSLVFGDRAHLIDPFTPLELFMDEFQKHKRDWLIERVTQRGKDRYIYDQNKIVAHFKGFDFRNSRGQAVEVIGNALGTRLRIRVTPNKEEGGSSLADLEGAQPKFDQSLSALSRNQRAILMFWVHPNSFNTYLRARPLADKHRLPAGWEIRGQHFYDIVVTEVEVRPLQAPPKPDPNAPPPKPRPPGIKPSLD